MSRDEVSTGNAVSTKLSSVAFPLVIPIGSLSDRLAVRNSVTMFPAETSFPLATAAYSGLELDEVAETLIQDHHLGDRKTKMTFMFQMMDKVGPYLAEKGADYGFTVVKDRSNDAIVALMETSTRYNDKRTFRLDVFEVLEAYRGRGIGTMLLHEFLHLHVKTLGLYVDFCCHHSNVDFYRKAIATCPPITTEGSYDTKVVPIQDDYFFTVEWVPKQGPG